MINDLFACRKHRISSHFLLSLFLNNELSSSVFREVEENLLRCEFISIVVLILEWIRMNQTFERKWHQVVSFFLNVLQFLIKPIVIEPSSRKSFICKRHITPIILVFVFCSLGMCFFFLHIIRLHPSFISHFTKLIYYSNLISTLIARLEYIFVETFIRVFPLFWFREVTRSLIFFEMAQEIEI